MDGRLRGATRRWMSPQAAALVNRDRHLHLLRGVAQPTPQVGLRNHFIHIRHDGSSMTDMNDPGQSDVHGAMDPAYVATASRIGR